MASSKQQSAARPSRELRLAAMALAVAAALPAAAADLPVVCIAGRCGNGALDLSPAIASLRQTASTLDVDQHVENAIFNWSSFDISADGTVNFNQPSSSSVALNQIFEKAPSQIFGALNANGRVYLINRNGIVFGRGAQVNVGGLLASTLDLTPEAVTAGIAAPALHGGAALAETATPDGVPAGSVTVQRGAFIKTSEGGQVLMFAPKVVNEGEIRTPGGQTMLAAGKSVFLAVSNDDNLRGLLVEVDVGGEVTNGAASNASVQDPAALVGQIVAERGNVTLAGLAVNQLGRVSATTSVRANGTIRLQARDGGRASGGVLSVGGPATGGALTLGPNSATDIALATGGETTVDVNAQQKSRVELFGKTIDLLGGSEIVAKSGVVTATAQEDWSGDRLQTLGVPTGVPSDFRSELDASRVYLADDARIDVSGENIELPMERNTIEIELRGSQLADSPAQRDGALRSKKVRIDLRRTGTREDGTTWQGTPLADASGDIGTIDRDVQERSLTGGLVNLVSNGDLVVSQGATVDVSGGSIRYRDGFVNTSQVVDVYGRPYDIAEAGPNRQYAAITDSFTRRHEKWGITETFAGFLAPSRFESGYLEGKDAGTVRLVGSRAVTDGRFVAATQVGRHQRAVSGLVVAGRLYRPFDQIPFGGELIVGSDATADVENRPRLTTSVVLDSRPQGPDVSAELGHVFDPLTERLPESAETARLRPELLEERGFSRLRVLAQELIDLPSNVDLKLPPAARLDLDAVEDIRIGGTLRAASGTLNATAASTVSFAATARVDMSGLWVNDSALLNRDGLLSPLPIDGGAVSLRAGTVTTAAGSTIDVSGGAWLDSHGHPSFGSGGSIRFSGNATADVTGGLPPLQLAGGMAAYGFRRNGSLSIAAPYICITASDCPALPENAVALSPELFASGAFESYSFESSFGLRIRGGTVVIPSQQNFEETRALGGLATGTPVADFTRVVSLPEEKRRGTHLSFEHSFEALPEDPLTADNFDTAGDLVLEKGAALLGDTGSTFELASNTRMLLDGTVRAPAGSIDAKLAGPPVATGLFVPSHGLWLGGDARLEARGVSVAQVADTGLVVGEVLDGGSIHLQADAGYLVLNPGAVLDVSGAADVLDVRVAAGAATAYEHRTVASRGGDITLAASQGIVNNAALRLQSGAPGAAAGGSLAFTLLGTEPIVMGDRVLQVQQSVASTAVGYGVNVSDNVNGIARLSADAINSSGADTLTLTASNIRSSTTQVGTGRVSFVGDVALHVRGSLTLDVAAIESNGGTATLDSAYVAIGRPDPTDQATLPEAAAGSGSLRVAADLVDLIGTWTATGFEKLALASRGDLRLRGVQLAGTSSVDGKLTTAADVLLEARQIYPSTLTSYTIAVARTTEDGVAGTIETRTAPGAAGPVLSAGGGLHLEADTIVHGGVLRAPFGEVSFDARDLSMQGGSIASTSGAGSIVPFGTTQGGFDWVYELPDGNQTLVFNDDELDLPSQRVVLRADAIDMQPGAVVDMRGGGELLAYEWVPGIGGTRDVLATSVRPNQYAVLPGLGFAPYDPTESQGFGAPVGSSITIPVGSHGLPAGTYALLPARYALLPGAFLVTPAAGYTDIVPGETFARLDGGTVVAGLRSVAGTALASPRTEGFSIRPGTAALEEARYDLSHATEFFSSERTAAAFRTPRDAGTLALLPRESLRLGGTVLSAPAEHGRGAALELTADRLEIAASESAAAVEGDGAEPVVRISASALGSFGAESLLIGARTVGSEDLTEAGVTEPFTVLGDLATNVTVDAGVNLGADEIVIAARDRLTIQSGATVRGTAGAARNYERLFLDGDSALIRLSGGEQAAVSRTNAAELGGAVDLEAGSELRAPGALLLDVTGASTLDGNLDATGASLSLGASSIALGAAEPGAAALVLDEAKLGTLDPLELILSTGRALDVHGSVAVAAQRLTLRAPGIRAATENAKLRLDAAGAFSLSTPKGALPLDPATPGASASASASIDVHADSIELGAGSFEAAGFGSVSLTARKDVVVAAHGSLTTDGDLSLATPRLVAADGIEYSVKAPGALAITSAAGASSPAARVGAGVGARLDLAGASVSLDTTIDLPSGVLTATALDGDVTVGSSGRIAARGVSAVFDGVVRAAAGGSIGLESRGGAITLAQGSELDVSAAAERGAAAGAIRILAPHGSIGAGGRLAGAAAGGAGGRIEVDGQSFGDFSALNAVLNAGEFAGERRIRQRGPGDLVVGAADVVKANDVRLSADGGGLVVQGTIDARGEHGGTAQLFGRDGLALSGSVLASANGPNERGGRVDLGATLGDVTLGAASLVDVSGTGGAAKDGDVAVRMRRDLIQSLLDDQRSHDPLVLAGQVRGYRSLTVEAVRTYVESDGAVTAEQVAADPSNPWYQDAADLMGAAAELAAAVGRDEDPLFRIVPGIEVTSDGDLSLNAAWDLTRWRFDGRAGVLTLAAAGNLKINASLDDVTNGIASATEDSWQYRLVGGRDALAANPLGVVARGEPGTAGSVVVAPGKLPVVRPPQPARPIIVRTATGRIDVAAANDFVLSNQLSELYTTGIPSATGIPLTSGGGLGGRPYPTAGGDIGIRAGGDIKQLGAPGTELVNDWLWRTGSNTTQFTSSATGWTVAPERFEQNVAAFGGGNIELDAGGDVANFSASIPSIGRQVGGTLPATSRVEIIGDGRLDVHARGGIYGGSYYVGLGDARLEAGDSIGKAPAGTASTTSPFAPVVALGDASFALTARSGVDLGAVVNPTLLPQGKSQTGITVLTRSHFTTYSGASRLDVLSAAGKVRLGGVDSALQASFSTLRTDPPFDFLMYLLPPALDATAFAGDLELGHLSLYPAPNGTFNLFAGRDVVIGRANNSLAEIVLSDADPALLLTVDRPLPNLQNLQNVFKNLSDPVRTGNTRQLPGFYSPVPTHSAERRADGRADQEPARIVALEGDVRMPSLGNNTIVFSAKPLDVSAGRDVRDLAILAENLDDASSTSISAGRDIIYSLSRGEDGGLASTERALAVSGPGQFLLSAGRDLDLQTSQGVLARGDLFNPSLPDDGANVSVLVGLNGAAPDYAAFIDKYLTKSDVYDDRLVDYVEAIGATPTSGNAGAPHAFSALAPHAATPATDKAGALRAFDALASKQQRRLLESILFAELRAGGRVAANAGPQHGDYTRAFTALTTMFPGSNPDTDAGQTNRYSGDVRLFFSQIYTLDGGDISLLAPGGGINVGLASPPSAFGIEKQAAELGVVAQSRGDVNVAGFGDFQVNESRTFAADGGNILVWSTRGDIDAGRGAKTAISAPPPTITIDANGGIIVKFPDALTGSGIQTLATSEGTKPGDVDLYAPRGVVNAGDAGIVAGNLTIGATAVLGADNISVSGVSVGVPVDTGGFGAALTGVSAVASSATSAAEDTVAATREQQESQTPLADTALSFLDVFVTGFGDENGNQKQNDEDDDKK